MKRALEEAPSLQEEAASPASAQHGEASKPSAQEGWPSAAQEEQAKKPSAHQSRLRRCGVPLQVDELEPLDFGAGVVGCEGFTVLRRGLLLDASADALADAATVYDELGSASSDRLSWTALRDGGNVDGLCDTVKAYCGTYEGMMARGGRYRQQLLVRGRKAEPLLGLPRITHMRKAVLGAVARLVAASAWPAAPRVALLTEQLIRYLPSDRWFAPHYDKDRRDTSHAPLDPKAFDGPGDLLATLCLGCGRASAPCTPVRPMHPPRHPQAASPSSTSPAGATARCSCCRARGTRRPADAPSACSCARATCTCCTTLRAGSGSTASRSRTTSRSRAARWSGACSSVERSFDAHVTFPRLLNNRPTVSVTR